jgi:hypothetical protein
MSYKRKSKLPVKLTHPKIDDGFLEAACDLNPFHALLIQVYHLGLMNMKIMQIHCGEEVKNSFDHLFDTF